MSFSVRQLGAEDLAAYRELRLEALTLAPTAFGSDLPRESAFSDWEWLARLTTNTTYGLFEGDALVGIATFARQARLKQRHRGDIFGVYVKPAARGTGAARLLLEHLIGSIDAAIVQVQLTVTANNVAAIRLYRRLGFQTYGTEPRSLCVDGCYYDEDLMVLRLDGGRQESDRND